ncbi:hypothetical protein [Candidatus Venteria ishoeyi]|uniref:Uncharacterized protein n=1 Tax=Candidatus Venteria ishoeyi TaxID=1899563 RepID=A0A1H6F2K6_9GAMM|nr:hypothetical protein [Candidatus Venteria ishoeyi]MDM8547704.1 hypothetical protein [Candidatus Venteria ishoeyi]SEH04398.1 Uncharacterised protein [Candidatus Venteria ishoeyi]
MSNIQKIAVLILIAALAGGGALFYRMVEHMAVMTGLMGEMAQDISTMSKEISAMNQEFHLMREEVQGIHKSVGNMDQTFSQGPSQLKQLNPMQMMEGAFPGQR